MSTEPTSVLCVSFIHYRHKKVDVSKSVCLNSRQDKNRKVINRHPPTEALTSYLGRDVLPKDYVGILLARMVSHEHSYYKRG